LDVQVEGQTDPRFDRVKQSFAELWSGIEVGAALCVYYQGQPVVDLWGGYTDRERQTPWRADTLVNVYSTTKGIAAFTFALLVDDGKICYEDKVADYWPEFAVNGKANITVAQLLSHQAGLCGVDETLRVEDLYDWAKMVRLLAEQKPLWSPGKASGYHAVTWGYLVGELALRITGMTLGELFQNRVANPLGLNFYLGLPVEKHAECASLIGPNHARSSIQVNAGGTNQAVPPNKYFQASLLNPPISPFKDACSKEWRLAEIAASNGHGDARSIARLYALMAGDGELRGTRLISQQTITAARKPEVENSVDLVTGTKIRRSRGFILSHGGNYGPGQHAFGHAGAGGSMAFADPDAELSFCYVMNQMQPDSETETRAAKLIRSTYNAIENIPT
tara:strand:+ start:18742 stop:19917 length:1176 start_codon:yes stop_codon:yes gene_type:complete